MDRARSKVKISILLMLMITAFTTSFADDHESKEMTIKALQKQVQEENLIKPVDIESLGVSDSISTEAFNSVAQTVSPLTIDQAKTIRHLWNESQRMTTFKGAAPPEPINSSKIISLENGKLPTVVRLSAGYVSVIAFYDATGAIWPIRGYSIGNPSAVNIVWNEGTAEEEITGEGYSNTLLLQAQTLYKTTNMVIMLRGMNTPVVLDLIPGQAQVDYRMDLQVPKQGPLAKKSVGDDILSGGNIPGYLTDLVNNIPPAKSVQAHVSGGDAQAWIYKKRLLIRTPLEIISPAWSTKLNGPNGLVHVYELPLTSSVIALRNGDVVKLKIEGV